MATTTRRALGGLVLVILVGLVWWWRTPSSPTLSAAFPYAVLRIGIDPSYPPFAADTGVSLEGLDIDLGKAMGVALNLPVEFVLTGYDGAYDALTTDKVDIIISALVVNPLRTQEVRYTQGYFDNGLLLVSPAQQPLATMAEIATRRLAVEFGSAADNEARLWSRRIAAFELRPYELPDYALDAVRLGEADAALVDATTYHLYQRQQPDWQVHTVYMTHAWYAIGVRIDREATWQIIDRTLTQFRQDGTLDTLIRKWL
jgi:ABC-type amino acid transport substrate-binding protein